MEFWIKAAQFILSLSLIVVLHEMGHFLPARWFGTRVERFFLFFDPKFALWKRKIGDTVYGIGWIPLGGYVKIAGMVDESMDREQMARPPEPWEFRAKPAWQRLIIMVGGVTVNLVLGMLIYIGVLFVWGKEYLPAENLTYGVQPSSLMKEMGFRDGDRILALEGERVKSIDDVGRKILLDDARIITIEREGKELEMVLPTDISDQVLERNEKVLFAPGVPFYVDSMVPDGNAVKSELRKGDRLVGVAGQPTPYFTQFSETVGKHAGSQVMVQVIRAGRELEIPVEVSAAGKIGVFNRPLNAYFEFENEQFGFLASIPAGIAYGWSTLSGYVSSLKLLFSSSGVKQLGGFGAIGSLYSPTWDWQRFWEMTAFLSVALAFMNILPIPALDGGHAMFLTYEIITRRQPNQKVLEYAQVAGMVFLLALILFSNGNDVVKWLSGKM
ncbi:MAG: RIP metalloprotease RseP [Flavobacteriales bacterium]|nr:RIP metalloprotease RseP [Flavobacteriales bacterium]